MNQSKQTYKGGRPRKKVKKNERISVRFSLLEYKIILNRAKKVNLTKSEFLREAALQAKVISKSIPKEILMFKADLNHLASNINQIARSANTNKFLNTNEIAYLKDLVLQIKEMVTEKLK